MKSAIYVWLNQFTQIHQKIVNIHLKQVEQTKYDIFKKNFYTFSYTEHNNEEMHEAEYFCRSLFCEF